MRSPEFRIARCFVLLFLLSLLSPLPLCGGLPIPNELQKSPSGTLTLLDCRGREIAELASPEARTQFPVALEQMGPWLPRVTVALEDRRFYEHRGVDWRADRCRVRTEFAIAANCFGRIHDHPATRETREQP